MNIYKNLNKAINYIEENLDEEIEYRKIAQILEMNEYTAQTAFYVLCNVTIADYIRKRRLSNAGYDLYNSDEKITDIAIKYQYTSPTAFSRAFEKFHGIKPSLVKQNPQGLKIFSKIEFDENQKEKTTIEYNIEEKEEIVLYGIGQKTTIENIQKDAPLIWQNEYKKYGKQYGLFDYGMTSYEKKRFECQNCKYWVLYDKKIDNKDFQKIIIPKSKWIIFKINSQETKDIQETTQRFYKEFLPSTKYKIRNIPELEHYYNDDYTTDFMIPIED